MVGGYRLLNTIDSQWGYISNPAGLLNVLSTVVASPMPVPWFWYKTCCCSAGEAVKCTKSRSLYPWPGGLLIVYTTRVRLDLPLLES